MNDQNKNKPSAWQLLLSALAAFIGIQNRENREKDFSHNSFVPFLIAGVIVTAVFFAILITVGMAISPD